MKNIKRSSLVFMDIWRIINAVYFKVRLDLGQHYGLDDTIPLLTAKSTVVCSMLQEITLL